MAHQPWTKGRYWAGAAHRSLSICPWFSYPSSCGPRLLRNPPSARLFVKKVEVKSGYVEGRPSFPHLALRLKKDAVVRCVLLNPPMVGGKVRSHDVCAGCFPPFLLSGGTTYHTMYAWAVDGTKERYRENRRLSNQPIAAIKLVQVANLEISLLKLAIEASSA